MRTKTRSGAKAGLTPDRVRAVVENGEFTAFSRRVLAAAGRRVAAGDVDGLPELAALAVAVDAAIANAVAGLRAAGYSWAEIAARLGVTRQAAYRRLAASDTATQGRVS